MLTPTGPESAARDLVVPATVNQEVNMFGDKKKAPTSAIETLIGKDTVIRGDVIFKGGLRIDGRVNGNVIAEEGAQGMLVLSENACIEGQVHASHLVINGMINGPVLSEELIELQSKARVTGDVRYRSLEMHNGAVVDGSMSHLDGTRPSLKLAASND